MIPAKLIEDTARELMARAAIDIPADYRNGVRLARDREAGRLARFVLTQMLENWDIATAERRPMCADTGLPRYYVKLGNEAAVEGGLVALERALRRATAEATAAIPLRPNRVHPLTRELSERFQMLIDSVAMQLGLQDEAAYLDLWTRSEAAERPGTAADVAAAVVAELEGRFTEFIGLAFRRP